MSLTTQASEWCNPAPYGKACVGCSRAKCKCFYRSDGTECERCHRLGRKCEPAIAIRKRKAQEQLVPPASRLEEKLDDLVSLLRSQATEKQALAGERVMQSPSNGGTTPSSLSTLVGSNDSISTPMVLAPELALDATAGMVHLLRPAEPVPTVGLSLSKPPSPLMDDIAHYNIPDWMAEEQLDAFRRAFLSLLPCVYIPSTTSVSDLRQERPFLWLVIMCLTTKNIPNQFEMEETIWSIISRRVVSQHLASLDLLLGIVCFASWSHYFKQDKPFMGMLTHLAVSLAFDLNLHKEAPLRALRRYKSGGIRAHMPPRQSLRTLEERRTFLAVFHLTSATWTSYRQTEPLPWTPYMDDCLQILVEENETPMDVLLATQVKCHIIENQLTCKRPDERMDGESSQAPSAALLAAMLSQLKGIQRALPAHIQSHRTTQFYLLNAEITIKESALSKPTQRDGTGFSHYRRLEDLESILATVEHWLEFFFEVPLIDLVGISVDYIAQFLHCVVVLYKLTTLKEEGWDPENVKRRVNVFDVLDRTCEAIDRVPVVLGMVDVDGPRSGLFFKTSYLFRAVKALLIAEMSPEIIPEAGQQTTHGAGGSYGAAGEVPISDDFLMNLANEPWMSNIFDSSWDLGLEVSHNSEVGQFGGW